MIVDQMHFFKVAQCGMYIVPWSTNWPITGLWRENNDITPGRYGDVLARCRTYAEEHNMMVAFVSPKLHQREQLRWKRRNGKYPPELTTRFAARQNAVG